MRQFVAVAEELHFGRAARRLNMAQPPLSNAMKRLEIDLGAELFDRSRRAVELTKAGKVFLAEARRILLQVNLAYELTRRAAAETIEVRICFIGPALYRFLPDLVLRFRETFPHIETRLFEQASEAQFKGVLGGEYDFGLVSVLTDHIPGLESMVVERSGRCAAVPADWDLAARDSISIEELAAHPFIMPPQKYAPYYSEITAMFQEHGIAPRIAQEASQTNTTLSLVGAGLGCSIVMEHAARAQPYNVKLMPIETLDEYKPWELTMIWGSDHSSPITEGFLRVTRQYLADNPSLLEDPRTRDQ